MWACVHAYVRGFTRVVLWTDRENNEIISGRRGREAEEEEGEKSVKLKMRRRDEQGGGRTRRSRGR